MDSEVLTTSLIKNPLLIMSATVTISNWLLTILMPKITWYQTRFLDNLEIDLNNADVWVCNYRPKGHAIIL